MGEQVYVHEPEIEGTHPSKDITLSVPTGVVFLVSVSRSLK